MTTQHNDKSDWNATQYLKFNDERSIPSTDLLAKVPLSSPNHIIDLGCGPGNSTLILRHRYPAATIQGMDSSPDMLSKARATLPDISFTQADVTDYAAPANVDLLFSNAVFQWLPDAQRLPTMQRLLGSLRAGGVLAVQVPDNTDEPSHRLMREVAEEEGPWKATLDRVKPARAPFPDVPQLYDGLRPLCARLDVWHTLYYHVLDDPAAIVEWVKGTGLRPFVDPLSRDQREAYLARYLARLAEVYRPLHDGKVVLKYPRLFIVAVRG